MEEENYRNTQTQILLMAQLVKDLPLTDFIRAIDKADALGPLLDPTLWMRSQKTMRNIKRIAMSLSSFQADAKTFFKANP